MALRMKYFGMVAQALGRTEERRAVDGAMDTETLKRQMIEECPDLAHVPFQIAVDQALAQTPISLQDDMEVALLPPFAGG